MRRLACRARSTSNGSLRMQQILAYETDLLEFGDLFDGSAVMDKKVEELKEAARAELATLDKNGGAVAALKPAP